MTHILMVATGVPELTKGSPIRNYNLLAQLSKNKDYRVGLVCLGTAAKTTLDEKRLKDDLGIVAHIYPHTEPTLLWGLQAIIQDRMQPYMSRYRRHTELGKGVWNYCEKYRPDIIQIEQLDAYYSVLPYLQRIESMGTKIVLDAHNIELQAFKETIQPMSFLKKQIARYLMAPLRSLEKEAAVRSNAVLTCSEYDTAHFKTLSKSNLVFTIPNGVDCDSVKLNSHKGNPQLLFIGGVDYPPNRDALDFYFDTIHEPAREQDSNFKLTVIGKGTDTWLTSKGKDPEGIKAAGFVDSIDGYINRANIGICPVRQGSGTRIKILTYMAAGLAVISTDKGAEGINYVSGKEVLIANTAQEFSEAIVTLSRDPKLCARMGKAARRRVTKEYDWKNIGVTLRSVYGSLTGVS